MNAGHEYWDATKDPKKVLFEVAPWVGALPAESPAATSVREWWASAQRVYPANTQRAWRADWFIYAAFCAERGASTVPAMSSTVAAFVDACGEAGKKPATIRRYLSTIALAHRVATFANPCAEEPGRHALEG